MMKKTQKNIHWIVGATIAVGLTIVLTLYLDNKNSETPIVQTTLPDLDQTFATGRTLYQSNCSSCHGQALGGRKGLGPPFIHGYYKPSHHSDIAFYRAIEIGVVAHHWQFGNMPPVPALSKREAKAIIRYIRAVQQENGIS